MKDAPKVNNISLIWPWINFAVEMAGRFVLYICKTHNSMVILLYWLVIFFKDSRSVSEKSPWNIEGKISPTCSNVIRSHILSNTLTLCYVTICPKVFIKAVGLSCNFTLQHHEESCCISTADQSLGQRTRWETLRKIVCF